MRCEYCHGLGKLLARNGIDFPFSPELSSTVAYKCPECDGSGFGYCCEGLKNEPEGEAHDR